jgi:hypothetical protein
MATKKSLVKPKPRTLGEAEKDLRNIKAGRNTKGPAGYTVRNAKGVKVNKERK